MPYGETQAMAPGRSYERTHPWLTFALDLGRFQHTDWLALGEATSMIDRIAEAPLAPTVAEDIHKLYLAKGRARDDRYRGQHPVGGGSS